MSNDQDYVERVFDAPPEASIEAVEAARAPNTVGWWLAAVVAVCAVIGAVYVLSGARTSPARPPGVDDGGRIEAQIDGPTATRAAKAAQVATAIRTQTTEAAAEAASAEAGGQSASASQATPQP